MTSNPRGASRIQISTSRLTQSNANTFVRARAHGLFLPRVLGSTSGTPLGACGTLGVSPQLIPPHSVEYPHTSLASLKYCYIVSCHALSTCGTQCTAHQIWVLSRQTSIPPSNGRQRIGRSHCAVAPLNDSEWGARTQVNNLDRQSAKLAIAVS